MIRDAAGRTLIERAHARGLFTDHPGRALAVLDPGRRPAPHCGAR